MADSLSNKPKNIHEHTHVHLLPYLAIALKKLQNVILLSFYSVGLIQYYLNSHLGFYINPFSFITRMHACVMKVSQLLSEKFSMFH